MDLSRLILYWYPRYTLVYRDNYYQLEIYSPIPFPDPQLQKKLSMLTVIKDGHEILKRSLETHEVKAIIARLEDLRFDFDSKLFGSTIPSESYRLKIKAKDLALDITWDTKESGLHPKSEIALARLLATFESIQKTEILGFEQLI
jgi:hypothetical protein